MGIAYKAQGKLDKAIDSFKKAISLKPNYAEAYNNLGLALNEKNNSTEDIGSLLTGLKLLSDYSWKTCLCET